MNQNRQPKGTTIGGQFAQSKNPESNLVLSDVPEMRPYSGGRPQPGVVLSRGAAVVEWDGWADESYEYSVAVWLREHGDDDRAPDELWEPRMVRTILTEQGHDPHEVRYEEIVNTANESEYLKVAFNPSWNEGQLAGDPDTCPMCGESEYIDHSDPEDGSAWDGERRCMECGYEWN